MSDLIRKEDALMQARPEYLNPQQQKLASYNQGWNDALDEYFDRIKEIPSADRPISEWILCSERLPSERGWYLITVQDVNRFTDVDYYYGNSEWDEVSSKQEVIAWMPLPKPYREDDEA